MKKMLRSAAALTLAGCMMSANVLAATTFSDVPASYWGASFITRAAGKGVVSGLPDGSYGVEKKVSAAEFATMVCNLFYKEQVANYTRQYASQLAGQAWWYAYVSVAYEKGLLNNTVAGEYRKNYSAWAKDLIEGELSRYDMAQILVNVAAVKGWSSASPVDILASQTKIKDWSTIPQKYQSAVANSYAKGFLSGMGNGNFEGAASMTRTHAAVVLCKLMDEEENQKKNTYTNTDKLVNGKAPTQGNVSAALAALKTEFPRNTVWNGDTVYTSGVLGSTYGCDAYAYTISDRVFGNLKASKVSSFDDMKVGDLLYLNSLKSHVVITGVDGDEFDYTYCTSNAAVSWSGYGDIDDLTSKDTLYTRYSDDTADEDQALTNGKKATEGNVEDLIDEFLDDEYDYGDEWDINYKTDSFSTSTKTYSGNQAFAYYLSDYIFGELEVREVDDLDDLRIGDIIYVDTDDEYVVITDITGDEIDCIGVDSDDEVYAGEIDVDDLSLRWDSAYTRYPSSGSSSSSGSGSSSNSKDDSLANGKSVTESNVISLLDDFKDEEYDEGTKWDMNESYKFPAFSKRSISGEQAFAYYLSDYIFGDLEVNEVYVEDIRVGDVLVLSDEASYGVVVDVDESYDEITYVSVNSKGKVSWEYVIDMEDLDDSEDIIYSRYLTTDERLTNGKSVTEANVRVLLESVSEKSAYKAGGTWDMDIVYNTEVFGRAYGSEAFAAMVSDEVFGDLDVWELKYVENLRVGDIIYLWDYDVYAVVSDVYTRNSKDYFRYSYADDDGEIMWDVLMEVGDLRDGKDEVYTRYP